jgi:hypothetical protein
VAFILASIQADWSRRMDTQTVKMQRVEDRRIFERIPVSFSVRIRDVNSNRWGLAQSRDISANGIGLHSDTELLPRTPVELWLPLPNKGETLYTKGEVVWSRRLEPNTYNFGVCLEQADLMGISQVLKGVKR